MNYTISNTKYDTSLEQSYCFYDYLPYERNMDVCGNDCVRKVSGNVIKAYACKETNAIEIPNQEERLLALLGE